MVLLGPHHHHHRHHHHTDDDVGVPPCFLNTFNNEADSASFCGLQSGRCEMASEQCSGELAQSWLLWTNKSQGHYFNRQRRVNTFHNQMCTCPTYADTDSFSLSLFIWKWRSVTTLPSEAVLLESVDPPLLRFYVLFLVYRSVVFLAVCRCSVVMCAALSTPPPPSV